MIELHLTEVEVPGQPKLEEGVDMSLATGQVAVPRAGEIIVAMSEWRVLNVSWEFRGGLALVTLFCHRIPVAPAPSATQTD
jgi:hypothetical protein